MLMALWVTVAFWVPSKQNKKSYSSKNDLKRNHLVFKVHFVLVATFIGVISCYLFGPFVCMKKSVIDVWMVH